MADLVPRKATLNLREVAELFGVHSKTVQRWIEQGILPEVPLPAGKHRRIPRPAVLELLSTKRKSTAKA
jgi:excisionase family DNA binding protein